MDLHNNYVITNDQFLQPTYRISPFTTRDIAKNIEITNSECIDTKLKDYFTGRKYTFTSSGRDALNKALKRYHLSEDDVVSILTTTGNLYISSCVTREIEKFCKWSREITDRTRIILVNHEFGFPYENLTELAKLGIPIIEDCAHSFASQNREFSVGNIGDYVIYSLPKFFPIQFGGILVNNKNESIKSDLNSCAEEYLEKIVNYYIPSINQIKDTRRQNYEYLVQKSKKLKVTQRLDLKENYCPGAYMFKLEEYNLSNLKIFMQSHGVESSVFYGEDSFFIPVNQSLKKVDLDYFILLIEKFMFESGD